MHIELQTFQATQPNTGAAGAALTGDSLTLRTSKSRVKVLAAWASRQVAGFSQFITPSMHDTTRGFRCGVAAAIGQLTMSLGQSLEFDEQEVLANTIAGSNTAGDIEQDSLLLWYDGSLSAQYLTAEQVRQQAVEFVNIESSITAVATGQYAEELITADSDTLRANTRYALLGMSSRTNAHALTFSGPDLANVRVGVPGNLRPELTQQWFTMLSRVHNLACVPVFNSGNRPQTRIGFCMNETAADTVVTAHLAQLR